MAGGAYIVIAICFGLGGGIIGKAKGSSFFIWFLIALIVPVIGIIVAVLYRNDHDEPEQPCPRCGKTVKLHDALCTRCGEELGFPGYTEEPSPAH